MDNIFRSIFGLPRRDDTGSWYPDSRECVPDEREEDDCHFSSPNFGGENTFLFTNPADVARQFDEIFASFERVFQGFGSFNAIEMPPADHYGADEDIASDSMPNVPDFGHAPRDNMLKHPDSLESDQIVPHNRRNRERHRNWFGNFWRKPRTRDDNIDSDVDESVRHGGLDSLFSDRDKGELEAMPMPYRDVVPRRQTVFRGVTVQTHRSADGRVTEVRKMVDNDGNEQTVVTRSINGQSIRETTKKNKKGETEVIEDLINMDESEKAKFDERWNTTKSQPSPPANDLLRSFQEDRAEDNSIFARLFGNDFRRF